MKKKQKEEISCSSTTTNSPHKELDSINVILPDGCPNKRRLPRNAEQLGRYSEGSQRRFLPPRIIQFPPVQRGCSLGVDELVELTWIAVVVYSNPRSVSRYELSLEKTRC